MIFVIAGETATSTGQTQMRLVNGATPLEGRLEVFHDGEWGTVCDDGFNNATARLICATFVNEYVQHFCPNFVMQLPLLMNCYISYCRL